MATLIVKIENSLTPQDLTEITRIASNSMQCVEIEKENSYKVDAKSILGLFTLSLQKGDTIIIRSDDEEILENISEVI
jgi:phosphotransferase system HPr (HPr) family protein